MENIISTILQKKIKEEKIMTQVELAKKMGVSTVAVSKWMNGANPEVEKLGLLCKVLNITPNELFGYDTPYRRKLADDLLNSYENHPQHKVSIDTLLEIK